MNKRWLTAVMAVLPLAAWAQDHKKSGEEKVAFEKRAYPFEAEVAAERLNVRMFPKSDQTSIITSVLSLGDKVTVVGEKEDYYQILPPRGSAVWVSGKNVKKEGTTGLATANDVPVRLDSRVNADVLCSLKEGESVTILSEHMGWLKIEAPQAVKYYVGKKYVKAGKALAADEASPAGPAARKADGRKTLLPEGKPDTDPAARAKLAVAEAQLDEQRKLVDAQKLDQVDFKDVVVTLEEAKNLATTEQVRGECDRMFKRYRDLHLAWSTTKEQLRSAEAEIARKKKEIEDTPAPAKAWTMTGYLDSTGMLWKRPGTHKLVMGGKIVCFVRIKETDEKMMTRLNDNFQKYVGIRGVVIKNPEGWEGYSVVVADEIEPLKD